MIQGAIYLANFPFGGSAGMKIRPVLALTGPIGDVPEVLVAYISSVLPLNLLPSDILLDMTSSEHRSTQLKSMSVIRLHKLATIHGRSLLRRMGSVSAQTLVDAQGRLGALIGL